MLVFETESITLRQAAITTGIAMIIMAICAMFAVGFVDNRFIIDGDATATVSNIKNSMSLFQAGIFSWLIILICDIILSWSLFVFLKQINSSLSLLGLLFRLMYTSFLGLAIFNLVRVAILLSDNEFLSFQTDELLSLAMLFIVSFQEFWSFGLIIFGIHLFIIGFLVIRSGFIPKLMGFLLLIASVSYMLVHTMYVFLPQYDNITRILENILSLPMTIGELGLGIWMLIKGGKTTKVEV